MQAQVCAAINMADEYQELLADDGNIAEAISECAYKSSEVSSAFRSGDALELGTLLLQSGNDYLMSIAALPPRP